MRNWISLTVAMLLLAAMCASYYPLWSNWDNSGRDGVARGGVLRDHGGMPSTSSVPYATPIATSSDAPVSIIGNQPGFPVSTSVPTFLGPRGENCNNTSENRTEPVQFFVHDAEMDERAISEIMEIRSRLGGGLTTVFADTEAHSAIDEEFKKHLQQAPLLPPRGPAVNPPDDIQTSFHHQITHSATAGLMGDHLQIPPGYRVIGVHVNPDDVALALQPKDRVDLVRRELQSGGHPIDVPVLENATVFGVYPHKQHNTLLVGILVENSKRMDLAELSQERLPVHVAVRGKINPDNSSPSEQVKVAVSDSPAFNTEPVVFVPELRHIARELDRIAADLEELNQFTDADRLREHAAQIRQKCR